MSIFELPVHPAADVFPMLDLDELSDLAADIKANGLQHPIVIGEVDGVEMLIDGRNRLAACKLAGVEPESKQLNGHDPESLIYSENILRRHMSKGQQAMAVAMMYPEAETLKRGGSVKITELGAANSGSISHARTVLKYAPQLVDKIMKNDPEKKKPLESLGSAYAYAQEIKRSKETADATVQREERERESTIRKLESNPEDRDIVDQFRAGELKADVAAGMVDTREEARRVDRQGWWDILSQLRNYGRMLNDNSVVELAKIYKSHGNETDVGLEDLVDEYINALTILRGEL